MKRSNLFLTTLLAIFTVTVLNAQSFGVDINAVNGGSPAAMAPYTVMPFNTEGNGMTGPTVMVGGVSFTLSGTKDLRSRDRGAASEEPANVLRDFVFLNDGTDGVFTMQITGLTAGQEYTINSYHFGQDFDSRMSVGLQENGIPIAGPAQIIDNDTTTPLAFDDVSTTTFTFSAVAAATYSIVATTLTGNDNGNRSRFNGVLVTETNILSVNNFSEDLVSSDVKVSPNPFSKSFSIDFDSKLSFTKGVIYNTLGQAVKTFSADSNMSQITFNGPAGIYFILFLDGQKVIANEKIMKK